jgi:SAM-dependent methyltransferase
VVVSSSLSKSLRLIGFDVERFRQSLLATPRFWRDLQRYRSASSRSFPFKIRNIRPMLLDYSAQAGVSNFHYFHQDLWASRLIFAAKPDRHFDIGSRIDGFIAHVLTFMPVSVFDIRPLPMNIQGLTFVQGDATNLTAIADGSIESLSCLHAVEHFGLGRYADPINPQACFTAMAEMQRVLKPGGRLYFSVPVGTERVEFNAHRVFDPRTILATFNELTLLSFSAVDDRGDFHQNTDPNHYTDARYACGMFEFTRTAS